MHIWGINVFIVSLVLFILQKEHVNIFLFKPTTIITLFIILFTITPPPPHYSYLMSGGWLIKDKYIFIACTTTQNWATHGGYPGPD